MSFALQCGLGCVYCITAGKSMHAIWNFACTEPCRPFGLSAWIVVFAALQILLSQVNYQMKSALIGIDQHCCSLAMSSGAPFPHG